MPDIETTSPAVELREAAKLMRQRAQAATHGPWSAWAMGSDGYLVLRPGGSARDRGRGRVARVGMKDWDTDRADAEHIAGMHPGVALAVAEWLETEANLAGRRGDSGEGQTFCALKVARAYLSTKEGQ